MAKPAPESLDFYITTLKTMLLRLCLKADMSDPLGELWSLQVGHYRLGPYCKPRWTIRLGMFLRRHKLIA